MKLCQADRDTIIALTIIFAVIGLLDTTQNILDYFHIMF